MDNLYQLLFESATLGGDDVVLFHGPIDHDGPISVVAHGPAGVVRLTVNPDGTITYPR